MWAAAAAQFAGGLGKGMGQAMTPAPAGPSSATGATYGGGGLDASGWSVNFGGSQIATPTSTHVEPTTALPMQGTPAPTQAAPVQAGGMLLALAVGGVALMMILRKGRK